MKRLAVIFLLSLVLMAPADPNKPLPSYMEKWTCIDALEVYTEAGALHQVAGERLNSSKSPAAKMFWAEVRQFTLSVHPDLLEARTRKCKAA